MFPIVLLEHPAFLGSASMARFATMLFDGFAARGHPVQRWSPADRVHKRFQRLRGAKWAGYIDQYLLFPSEVRRRMAQQPGDTLYVMCDQALGPWIPLVASRPHVVHAHDLLALRSALGEFDENPTRLSGRVYQRWIRSGFRQARHFIAVSRHTADELGRHLLRAPRTCEVVYNPVDPAFRPIAKTEAESLLRAAGLEPPAQGFVLHVGADTWYKNREGLVRLYAAWAAKQAPERIAALWLIGPPPGEALQQLIADLPAGAHVAFHQGLPQAALVACYALAQAFIFPSLAEGFGWPIAEALACGAPVLTTGEAPMTEVGADAAEYLTRMHAGQEAAWAEAGAVALQRLLDEPESQRAARRQRGFDAVARFEARRSIDGYAAIYERVHALETAGRAAR